MILLVWPGTMKPNILYRLRSMNKCTLHTAITITSDNSDNAYAAVNQQKFLKATMGNRLVMGIWFCTTDCSHIEIR